MYFGQYSYCSDQSQRPGVRSLGKLSKYAPERRPVDVRKANIQNIWPYHCSSDVHASDGRTIPSYCVCGYNRETGTDIDGHWQLDWPQRKHTCLAMAPPDGRAAAEGHVPLVANYHHGDKVAPLMIWHLDVRQEETYPVVNDLDD